MKTGFLKRMMVLAMVLLMALTCVSHAESAATDTQRLDTYYSLAISYINREDFDKAMEYLDACLEYCDETSNPDLCADIHLKKGCVHTMTGDSGNAVKELDEAIRIKDTLSEAWLVKTQVYSDEGKLPEAIESLEKYIEMTGDTGMYETLSQLYQQNGDAEKAFEAYNKYAEGSSDNEIEVGYRKGVYKMGVGMYEEAVEDFKPCLEDETYGVSAAYNLGVCQMNLGDYGSALAAFNQCAEAGGDYDGIHYNLGVCNMTLGNYAEAIGAFTASIDGESYKEDAIYNRAVCHMSAGSYVDAIADFTSYIDARAAAAQPEVAEGEEEAEPVNTVDVANYYRGVCYLSNGDYAEAAADFTRCIEGDVAADDSLFNRGLSYLQGGEFESAKEDFNACIKSGNSADEARFYRAYAYRYLGENENAIKDLTECIKNEYNLSQSYYQRAQVYNDMGDSDHYVEDLEASLNF